MQALLMAGGRGQRLGMNDIEKPLLEYKGKTFFLRVYESLRSSKIDNAFIVTSPFTPHTTYVAKKAKMCVVEAPGRGYIEDYCWTIKHLSMNEPVLIVAADLPLLTSQIIDKIIDYYTISKKQALAVYIQKKLCDMARCSYEFVLRGRHQMLVPAAVNIVDGRYIDEAQLETTFILDDEALLYNINTIADLERLTQTSII